MTRLEEDDVEERGQVLHTKRIIRLGVLNALHMTGPSYLYVIGLETELLWWVEVGGWFPEGE